MASKENVNLQEGATQKTKQEVAEGKVRIKLFKDNDKYKDDIFVGVNGVGYIVKRGVVVDVPAAVAEVLKNSEEQMMSASEFMEAKEEEYRKKTEELM